MSESTQRARTTQGLTVLAAVLLGVALAVVVATLASGPGSTLGLLGSLGGAALLVVVATAILRSARRGERP